MANPYGIEQVDVPGILGAYDAARQRRVQMMLQQTQLEREQNQLDRETKLHTAFSKFVVPGAGMSGAASSYGTPAPSAASPAPTMDPASPTAALASETTPAPAAAPSSAIPAPATDQRHPMASWMEANTPAIQDAMRADPQVGMQMIQNFSSLDAAAQQRVKAHLELADELNEHAIRHLATVHDQASWDAARTAYSAELQHYGAAPPDLPATYDPKYVQGLRVSTLSTKDQLDAAKGVVMGEGSTLNNPYTGEQLANNPKPTKFEHVIIPTGEGTGRGVTFDPDKGVYLDDATGQPLAGSPGAAGGSVRRTHGYTPRASNGGDNSDVVVNNKISALSHAVGVDPDTPMTSSQFVKFVQALPATEGSGNNNPGGIKDGAYARSQPGYAGAAGQYARFTTPEAGTAAMAQLLRRNYYDKGQTSIRDIIEGKPVGGSSAGAAQPGAASGAHSVSFPSQKTPEIPLTGAALDRAAAIYNQFGTLPSSIGRQGKNQVAVINRAAELAAGSNPTDQAAGWAGAKADTASLRTLQTQSDKVNASERTAALNGHLALQLAPTANVGNTPIFNRWVNAGRKGIGGDAALSRFDAAVKTFANEYANVVSVSTGNAVTSDTARQHAYEMINSAMAPEQFRGVMDTLFKEMGNRTTAMHQQISDINGRLRGNHSGASAPDAPSSAGIPTLSPEQARNAAPGTVFRTTDGRTMRKQ